MPSSKEDIVLSERFFDLADALVVELEAARHRKAALDPIEREHDCFLLDPGLGPATYLTRDGRVLWVDDGWGVVPTRAMVFAAIKSGAQKTGVEDLLSLLPSRPPESATCARCDGSGRFQLGGRASRSEEDGGSIVCPDCAGLGWSSPHLNLSLNTLWTNP